MISQAETASSQQQQKQQPPSSPPIKSPSILLKHESSPLTRQQSLSPQPNTKAKHIHHDTSHHHHHHHHHPSKQQTTTTTATTTTTTTTPTSPLHNTDNSCNSIKKSPSIKKRKRFEETIIEGFSIIAFKTWEDLQDELNERSCLNTATAAAADSASGNSYDHNVVKKAGSKSRHKSNNSSSDANVINSNGTSTTTTSVATTTSGHLHHHHHHKDGSKKKKKDKVRKSPSRSPDEQPKEKRNKTSSDKTTLKKALEAKELAEKRLSILQKKLEQEQNKNRSGSHVDPLSDQDQNQNKSTTSNVPDHHSLNAGTHLNSQEQQIRKEDLHTNMNYNSNSLGHDQIKQEQLNYLNAPKPAPYSPFHVNSHLQRTKTTIHQQHQPTHTPPPAPHPPMHPHLGQTSHLSPQKQPHMPTSNLLQPPNLQHRVTPPPQQDIRDSYYSKQRISTPPTSTQSTNYQQHRSPMHSHSQAAPHYMIPPHQQQHGQSLHNPYNPASLISSMGLNHLASPYSCPQICITDTISRQTSIIPPLGATLEQSTSQTSTRYGHHPSMLAAHPTAHLNPHHQMLYPMTPTPTERSFMEFVRSYPAPNHMSYPSLNSLIPPPPSAGSAAHTPAPPTPLHSLPHHPSGSLAVPPSFSASAYGSDRSAWPRPLGVDRAAAAAASRYNSLYPNPFCPIPERPSYASYAGGRPPPFHASLFQPPF